MIEVRKVYTDIALSEYALEYKDEKIRVWVNPTPAMIAELEEVREKLKTPTEEIVQQSAALLGKFWDEPGENVIAFFEKCRAADPLVFEFVMIRSLQAIFEHRITIKKKLMMPFLRLDGKDTPANR